MASPDFPRLRVNNLDDHSIATSDLLEIPIKNLEELDTRLVYLRKLIAETGRGRALAVSRHADTGRPWISVWTTSGARKENELAFMDFCKCTATAEDLERLVILANEDEGAWVADMLVAAERYCSAIKTICAYRYYPNREYRNGYAVLL